MSSEERVSRFAIFPVSRAPDELWQGDIYQSFDEETTRLGLVVSADCDLLHDKGTGEILCIPLVPIHDHLQAEVFRVVLADCENYELQELRNVVCGREPRFSNVSDDALRDWIENRDETQISNELNKPHVDQLAWIIALKRRLHGYRGFAALTNDEAAIPMPDFQSLLYAGSENEKLTKKVEACVKKAREFLIERLDVNRADLFVMPGVPGIVHALGYILPFRRIAVVPRQRFFQGLSEAKREKHGMCVIAACSAALSLAIVQKLTLFFSRIGIGRAFEVDQKALIQIVLQEVTGRKARNDQISGT